MYSKSQFCALEVMCRERAAVARKEMEYWLKEAEEWMRASSIAPFGVTRERGEPRTGKIDTSS
jgi:hypothetical protein